MKITYTKHALNKKEFLKKLGWDINLEQIEKTISSPDLTGITKQKQPTAISYLKDQYILRVVYEIRNDIILVITFHISKKGRYES